MSGATRTGSSTSWASPAIDEPAGERRRRPADAGRSRTESSAGSTAAASSCAATSTCRCAKVRTVAVEIADDLRIRAALPTLSWLAERGAAVTACSHLGRPAGTPDERFSLTPVAERLAASAPGVEMVENLRFHAGETANDAAFVDALVAGEIVVRFGNGTQRTPFDGYVNDAFRCQPPRSRVHRGTSPASAERSRPAAGPRGRGDRRPAC